MNAAPNDHAPTQPSRARVAVVGAGPAGLAAAEALVSGGVQVDVYDAMPSAGRKFLLAGKGGLNLTHSEPFAAFVERFGERASALEPMLLRFGADELRAWAAGLGIDTFVGTSGRVFPRDMKAAPLLRAWLHRLRTLGVSFHMRHRWLGFDDAAEHGVPALRMSSPTGELRVAADAVMLALGGASWPRLGSDGAWWPQLAERGIALAPLRPSNCGFDVAAAPGGGWSAHLRERFAGAPIKPVVLTFQGRDGARFRRQGEFVVTQGGIEGSLVYAASALLRDEIEAHGDATIELDLLPDRSAEFVAAEVARPRGSRSLATHLKSRLGIDGVKSALLVEVLGRDGVHDAARVTATLKALPLRLVAARPIAEAISSAGGVRFDALDDRLMLQRLPGVFCAGEMLDWEAPTGGYLLTASFTTGRAAGLGALKWLARL
ncbi:TIGR03862 family flavoprotein [Caldimonas sp. KR1-144]|uniref:TIGR03862 family flavoprotein n=1 Tax=Caldimonas sp. KR1-144 TaxID=3400911 RepID=UPI003C06D201